MAERDLSASYKTPKYFSSLSLLAKSPPRPLPIREDSTNLAPLSASKKHSDDSLPSYHLPLKSNSPKNSTISTGKGAYINTTPKLKPASTRPSPQGSPKSLFSSSSPDLTKTVQGSQAELDSAVVISHPSKQRLKTQYAGPRPILCQRTPSIPATPSELSVFRPVTASSFAGSLQSTPKSRTPRQFLSPLGKSTEKLASLVTQVKPIFSENTPAQAARNEDIYREHLYQTFLAIKFTKTLPPADLRQITNKKVILPRRTGYENKKTIVFDLDETLVHCVEEDKMRFADVVLSIRFPTGEVIKAGVNVRPFVQECLREANREFEVIVFTASHQCYADVVLDYLDPGKELIHHRLYRDNCICMQGVYIKDLRVLEGRSLAHTVIVDNAAYSFAYQLDNGVPIISWRNDKSDHELFNLIDYMKQLSAVEDTRILNAETFHLSTFYEDYITEFIRNPKATKGKLRRRRIC